MAEEELKLTRTIEVLNEYAEAWANAYRAELIAEGKRATGDLIKSVRGEVTIEGDIYSAVLNVADYYKYVEWGRRRGGKMPPVSAILKWVRVKPVIARPTTLSGRVPTQQQLAWAIAKSIQQNGIPPTYALRDTNDITFNAFEQRLKQALTEDLEGAAYTLVKRAINPDNAR